MHTHSFTFILFLCLTSLLNMGCGNQSGLDSGGSADTIVVHMPFRKGYTAMCTQGVNGSTSHRGTSTKYDLDFDTPNNQDDLVLAPVDGIARVHNNPTSGFGRHINIDLGDGTYIVLGHLDRIFIADRMYIGLGQVIATEGTTGNSSGDHVHMGRHVGDASQTATRGTSIPTLAVFAKDMSTGISEARLVSDYACALPGGRTYKSELPDVRSHPDGTLVMTPNDADIFILGGGYKTLFENEQVFWSQNRSFANVVLVSPEEMGCYRMGGVLRDQTQIAGAYDGQDMWLLFGRTDEPGRYRQKVNTLAWQAILASWGVQANSPTALNSGMGIANAYPRRGGFAPWRDGTLVMERGRSDVYVIESNVAFPIQNGSVMARLGFGNTPILHMDPGALVQTTYDTGNCSIGRYCVDNAFVEQCGATLLSGSFHMQTEPNDDSDRGDDEEDEEDEEETPTPEEDSTPPDEEETPTSEDEETPSPSEEETPTLEDDDTPVPTPDEPDPPPDPPPPAEVLDTLHVMWRTPANMQASRITLSGVYAPQGVELWWETLATINNDTIISYERPNMRRGDYLRFSVEYVMNGVTSWSCVGQFPQGRLQGLATASWHGQSVPVLQAGDPQGSPGCGLKATIP